MKSLYVDPFSPDNLANPAQFHRALHSGDPIVWLPQYNIYVTGRFEVAKQILSDPDCFQSREGVGLSDNRTTAVLPNSMAGNLATPSTGHMKRTPLVETDGAEHARSRALVEGALDASAIKSIIGESLSLAERLVRPLVDRGQFDAVGDLVIPVVLNAFPEAYGVAQDGRENLIALAELALNSLGPRNDIFKKSASCLPQLEQWIQRSLSVDTMGEEKIARRIYTAALSAGVSEDEARRLIKAVLISSVDTTVAGICNALYCLARQPEQWHRVRLQPELAVRAFEESTRLETPVQMCYRRVAYDCELHGMRLRQGTRIMVHLGAACRDPSYFSGPEEFDLARSSRHSLAFGSGIHRCLGQALARGQAVGLIQAMTQYIEHLQPVEPVTFLANNTLRRPVELLLSVSPARRGNG